MKKQLVYDLPIRIFHILFAGLFAISFLITKTVDDESTLFLYHMLAGFILVFLVLLRIIWGLVGTKYSKFTSFSLRPKDLLTYFTGIISGDHRKWVGHNPASSWAAVLMFGLALGLGATGYLMANGQKETFEDIHEIFANGFLVIVILHITGVFLHAFRHQDGIAMTMLGGAKNNISSAEAISKPRPLVALLFLGLVAGFAAHLVKNFDSQKQTLNFLGKTLQLGEDEKDDKHVRHKKHDKHKDD
jgi:cytochrome b